MNSFPDDSLADANAKKPALTASAEELATLLRVIEFDILPKTREGVGAGNKVFGAAVLDSDLNVKVADTNHETECPLFHGEVYVIQKWSNLIPAGERGASAASSVFLSTHEPCCMCISSIVWAGFQKVYYLFPYEATASQGIPHDIKIMHELWRVPTYNKRNQFCATASIGDFVEALDESLEQKKELKQTLKRLSDSYDELSSKYHSEKSSNNNNSLAFD